MLDQRILSRNKLSRLLCIPRRLLEEVASSAVRHYHPYTIEKSGGGVRIIDNPDDALKNIQHRINEVLLKTFPFPDYIHGGIKGHSPITNARPHLGRRLVVRLDLTDFFPSVTDRQVYSIWTRKVGCSPPVASLLTALTTFHHHLPQGSPTSTSLANLALLDVDAAILEMASVNGCSYSRYVDDLTISGAQARDLVKNIVFLLREAGFRISRRKLLFMPASGLQEVTGLTVNSSQSPSVSRLKRDRVRAAVRQFSQGPNPARAAVSARGRIGHFSRTNPGSARRLLEKLETPSLTTE